MSAVLTSPMPVTRPKIHRMPAKVVRKPEPVLSKSLASYGPHLVGGAVVLALLAAIPPQPKMTESHEKVSQAEMLPKISVTPRQDEAVAAPTETAPEAKIEAKEEVKSTTLAMNNPHVVPAAPVVQAPSAQVNGSKTIVLQDKNDSIIGQMARIPLENEQITEIKSASDVDNSAGRELLSIINKY